MIKKIEENKKNCKFFKNKFLEGERHRDWRRGKKVQRYKTKGWRRLLLQVSHVMLQRRTEQETRTVRRKTTKKKKIKQGTVGDMQSCQGMSTAAVHF
jgi:hypothetical protein